MDKLVIVALLCPVAWMISRPLVNALNRASAVTRKSDRHFVSGFAGRR